MGSIKGKGKKKSHNTPTELQQQKSTNWTILTNPTWSGFDEDCCITLPSETVQTWAPLTPGRCITTLFRWVAFKSDERHQVGTALNRNTWFNLFRVVWRLMLTRVWWCMEAKKKKAEQQQGEGRKSAYVMWRNLRVVKWAFWCWLFFVSIWEWESLMHVHGYHFRKSTIQCGSFFFSEN